MTDQDKSTPKIPDTFTAWDLDAGTVTFTAASGEKATFRINGQKYERELTAQELADLPEAWQNAKVDTSKYYQSALKAWEVDPKTYQQAKAAGRLCMQYKGRFYIA